METEPQNRDSSKEEAVSFIAGLTKPARWALCQSVCPERVLSAHQKLSLLLTLISSDRKAVLAFQGLSGEVQKLVTLTLHVEYQIKRSDQVSGISDRQYPLTGEQPFTV